LPSTLDQPLTWQERIESRLSLEATAGLRRKATIFFLGVLKENPFGLGTGFTNRFRTGPHNAFLKLAIDESIIAAICLAVMLLAAMWQALRLSSPALLSVCAIAWLAAMVDHTVTVEPLLPIALAIGLGVAIPSDRRIDAIEAGHAILAKSVDKTPA
jgi:hypothetical protein